MKIKELFRLLRGMRGRAARPVPESDEERRVRLLRRRKEKELENFWRYDGRRKRKGATRWRTRS